MSEGIQPQKHARLHEVIRRLKELKGRVDENTQKLRNHIDSIVGTVPQEVQSNDALPEADTPTPILSQLEQEIGNLSGKIDNFSSEVQRIVNDI